LNAGFKYEPFLYIYNIDGNLKTELAHFGVNVFLGYQFNNQLQAELHTGFNYVDDRYRGVDTGVRIRSSLLDWPLYFSGGLGITFLRNAANSHSFHSYEKNIFFGSLGIGTEIINNFELQLNYQFPIGNSQVGHSEFSTINPEDKLILRHKLIGMLKLGVGIAINL
jgi:hypothetical protein